MTGQDQTDKCIVCKRHFAHDDSGFFGHFAQESGEHTNWAAFICYECAGLHNIGPCSSCGVITKNTRLDNMEFFCPECRGITEESRTIDELYQKLRQSTAMKVVLDGNIIYNGQKRLQQEYQCIPIRLDILEKMLAGDAHNFMRMMLELLLGMYKNERS